MNSVFPDRFWSQNPVQQDPQNRSIDETWNTKTSNLERPLPPLPVSTHSRDNSANEDPFSSPLEQFYRQHSSQYQQKLNQSQQSFPTKLSLSNATSVDSFSFEKGQGRAGLKARRTRLEALVDSFSPYFSDWWLGEILCWVAGTLCIGAIILVLALYDGQPVPSRWPLGITLNAFISVISAVGKFSLAVPVNECIGELKWIWYSKPSALTQDDDQGSRLIDFETFDQASRGPWGAILLGARLRTRSIASIGATITVLSLALDPFFQQIVTYPQRPRTFGKSSLARVVNYDPEHYSYLKNGTKWIQAPDTLFTTIGGVVVDTLGEYITSAPAFCPSDDCRWPSFQTLGVCSQCKDISQYLTFACLEESGDWKANRPRKSNETTIPFTTSCGYFMNVTSENPMLMAGYNVAKDGSPGEALAARTFALHDFDSDKRYWDGSLLFKDTKVPLMDFFTVGVPDGQSPYSNSTPIALECVFKWCVKTMESTFTNSNLSEKVLHTFQNDTQILTDRSEFDAGRNVLRRIYHNESITPPGQDDTFRVDNQTSLEYALALSSVFPASLTAANATAQHVLKYHITTDNPTQSILTNFTAMRPPSDVPANMDKLAGALTDIMRSNTKSTELVFGTGSFEVFIHNFDINRCSGHSLLLPLDILFPQIVGYPQGFVPAPDLVRKILQALTYNVVDGFFAKNGSQLLIFSFDMAIATVPIFYSSRTISKLNGDCSPKIHSPCA
ncbi:hypothetical protein EG327_003521 [Venturia inaequalis]|uniref:Uncharacterized protein n=1 Tax=Venturia inaequalis TaxID=5025 RepID=A0A8H3ZC99_VENIN|nr:hypothetical protein EG327_003521 [Venturia inaequalis]